jgi:DNA-binding NarL/FixJ family response regulator
VAACEPTTEAAVANTSKESFDLVVLDLHLGKSDPVINLQYIQNKFPGKPVIIFTSEESEEWQRRIFEAGARGYVLKSAGPKEIMAIIEMVSTGKVVFPDFQNNNDTSSLTRNQQSILLDLAQGLGYKEIAKKKGTTVSTIEKTTLHLRNKFKAHNNIELITLLRDKNIL